MIFSDRQLVIAQQERKKLQDALLAVQNDTNSEKVWLRDIEAAALSSQIDELNVEIQEYEMLRSGQISFAESYSLSDLPRIPGAISDCQWIKSI